MSLGDGAVIVPIVAVILFLAIYPQFVLDRSEQAVQNSISPPGIVAIK